MDANHVLLENGQLAHVSSETELEKVVATLVLAFAADPIARWMHGGSASAHLRDFPRIMRVLGRDCLNGGAVTRTGDGSGVALWLPPNASSDDGEMTRVFSGAVPEHLQKDAGSLFAWADDNSPKEPFWHLSLIGVDPGAQNRGVGAALMTATLQRVDADRTPAYLWSSNPRNIAFYNRFGFEAVGASRFGSSPQVTAMMRPAR